MAYKNNWATGELIDATAFQELVNSAVYSFASLSAIQSNITSAIDGTGSGTKSPSLDLAVGFKYKFDISDAQTLDIH